ncbi:MAG: nucleotidyl transferase AbiEii/AbiGii toxin family protein [Candidatus Altiarchaeia archaeon]
MLSYESVIREAEARNMPREKIRGIVREYLQVIMLKHLYRSAYAGNFYFMGGTSLRLLYGLRRFSEGLDYNLKGLGKKGFEECAETIRKDLLKEGIPSELSFSHRDTLFIAEYSFKGIMEEYGVTDKRGELVIKFEANKPAYKLETETGVVSGYGELFIVNAMSKGSVFADKIDALRNKKIGRHVYDILFLLSKKFPVDRTLLKENGIKAEPKEALKEVFSGITDAKLIELAEKIKPFLFDPKEQELVRNAKIAVSNLASGYEF